MHHLKYQIANRSRPRMDENSRTQPQHQQKVLANPASIDSSSVIFPMSCRCVYQYFFPLLLLLLLLLLEMLADSGTATELKAYCGYPGRPYQAKIIPEEKLIFSDGEVISYKCANYWAPPQTRKCVKGVWVGPPARCGDFVPDLLMRHSQLFDLATGLEIFNYRDMNITTTDWKYPNSFTSNRFKLARLRVDDDHHYLWKFQFTHPAVKLFVKINVNFLNFTLLTEEFKRGFRFQIEVEISPYRTCQLDYQSNNPWGKNGNRIDSYFSCEANSHQDLVRDAAKPSNYMVMRTKSSHNISHELIAVFFGRAYGNESEPLCGEPEISYGQSFRANQENRDYMVDCANKDDWVDINPDPVRKFAYMIRCIGDMSWNGTVPRCMPRRTCSLENITELIAGPNSSRTKTDNHLVVDTVTKFFYLIDDDTIYATADTELTYSCDSDDHILVGKDTRTCKRDFKWSGHEPICKFIKSSNELIESSNYLLIIIVCMGALLVLILTISCVLLVLYNRRQKRRKQRRRQQKEDQQMDRARLEKQYSLNIYDNIEMSSGGNRLGDNNNDDDGLYEIYERITDDPGSVVGYVDHYSPYSEPNHLYRQYSIDGAKPVQNSGHHQLNPDNFDDDDDDDDENTYIRMLRDSRKYVNVKSDRLHKAPPSADLRIGQLGLPVANGKVRETANIRNELDPRRKPEPSYLELIGPH